MAKHIYNLKRDCVTTVPDPRFSTVANKLGLLTLPPLVDLRPKCSPVRNQGKLGSCTGFACITGFREFLLLNSGKTFTTLSPLFEYYWERWRERSILEDSGAMIRDGMIVLLNRGASPEADWPYDISQFTVQPPPQVRKDAKHYAITAFHRINNVIEIKQALSIGHPVVIGIEVWDSFESDTVAVSGLVPIPNRQVENNLGGHAVCIVGYDDSKQCFIVKNSWGTSWGAEGYFFLPYGYFNPALNLVMDMWTGKA